MIDKIIAGAEEVKKRRGRPPKPKNTASISTVQSQSMINKQIEETRDSQEVNKKDKKSRQIIKRYQNKNLDEKSLINFEQEIEIKNYPYLQQLLQHTRDQDFQFVLQADYSGKEQQSFKKGLNNILELVQRFGLSESTALIGVFLLRKFFNQICISYSNENKKGKKKQNSQNSKSTAERSSSGYYNKDLDNLNINYYSSVAFFVAAKYNEIQWPDLKEIIGEEFDLKVYLVRECELLETVDYQVPYPSHYLYLEIIVIMLNIQPEVEQKLRISFQKSLLKLNFFAICPREFVLFSVLIFLEFDQNFEKNLKQLSDYFDFPIHMLRNLRILHSVFINQLSQIVLCCF